MHRALNLTLSHFAILDTLCDGPLSTHDLVARLKIRNAAAREPLEEEDEEEIVKADGPGVYTRCVCLEKKDHGLLDRTPEVNLEIPVQTSKGIVKQNRKLRLWILTPKGERYLKGTRASL